jgi:dTDP-glucose 4,6-dehydratase
MRTLLVTGGCGFIGSNFIRHILKQDNQTRIINFDALTYAGNLGNLLDVYTDKRYKFVLGDIAVPEQINFAMKVYEPDWVVNFAADSHVDNSIQNASPFIRTNVQGMQVLLDSIKTYKVKLLHISTDEVYGSIELGKCADENTKFNPGNPYAASKASSEMLINAYKNTYKIDVITVRASNNYGPYQHPEKLIPCFIDRLLNNQKVPLYGNGSNIRDWMYVTDHTRALIELLEKGSLGQTYCVCTGTATSNLEIAYRLCDILEKSYSLIENVTDRLGHDFRYAMSYSKLYKELDWKPSFHLTEGLYETVKWYLNNKDGWVDTIKSGSYLKYYKKLYN